MAETRICQNMLVVVVKCVSPPPPDNLSRYRRHYVPSFFSLSFFPNFIPILPRNINVSKPVISIYRACYNEDKCQRINRKLDGKIVGKNFSPSYFLTRLASK